MARHGASTANTDILKLEKPENTKSGQLTANGHRMQYLLGKQIRKNYVALFKDMARDQFEVLSSLIPRCIQSAYSQLAGLFTLGSGLKVTPEGQTATLYTNPPLAGIESKLEGEFAIDKGYLVAPIKTNQYELDFIFMPWFDKSCPKIGTQVAEQYKANVKKYKYLTPQVSEDLKKAGFDSKALLYKDSFDLEDLGKIYDELVSNTNSYGRQDNRVSAELFKRLEQVSALEYNFWFDDKNWTRLFLDSLARHVISNMNRRQAEGESLKYRLLSGHDLNLLALDKVFNLTSVQCQLDVVEKGSTERPCLSLPEYGSSYIFELSTKAQTSEHFVRILRNGNSLKLCQENEDGHYCKYSDFQRLMESSVFYQNSDKDDVCGNSYIVGRNPIEDQSIQKYSRAPLYILGTLLLILVTANILLLLHPSIINFKKS